MTYHNIFPAEPDSIYPILEFIKIYAEKRQISSAVINQLMVATEEAIVNIISYGYPEKKGTIEVSCHPTKTKPGIRIVIRDRGVPFNPLVNAPAAPSNPDDILQKSENTLGGYGVLILTGLMDKVEYERIDDGNQLSLVKYTDHESIPTMNA